MSEITINRGSDLTFTGVWRDQAGAPLNLTGWQIAVFEPHPSVAAMTVEWVNAAVGSYIARLQWNDAIPSGRVANFRLRVSQGADDRSSPQIWVGVK
jgi:hypothetical protein